MHEEIELAPLEGDVVEPTPALPVPVEGGTPTWPACTTSPSS